MKVLHLLPALEQGGVESVVTALNRMLVGHGDESVVVSRGGRLVATILAAGGRHLQLDLKSKNPLTYWSRMVKLRRLLKAERPDLVCVHSRVPAWLLVGANRTLKLPWITYAHGANSVSAYSRIMTRGDRIVVPSEYLANYLQAHYQFERTKLRVIANPVQEDCFDPARLSASAAEEKLAAWGLEPEAAVVLAVGRITPLKGYDGLIRSFVQVRERVPQARLVIVGGADKDKTGCLNALKSLIGELKLEREVVLAGADEEIPACLAAARVLVSANVVKPETFGLSLVEAGLMNRPVIAKNFGGAKAVVENGVTGILVAGAEEFAGAITRVLSGEWQPAADLRARVLGRFNAERFAAETLKVYDEVTKGGG